MRGGIKGSLLWIYFYFIFILFFSFFLQCCAGRRDGLQVLLSHVDKRFYVFGDLNPIRSNVSKKKMLKDDYKI